MDEKKIFKSILEAIGQAIPAASQGTAGPAAPMAKKPQTIVRFNEGEPTQFDVVFSERGFSVAGTRLSFELLEDALSKNFLVTLDGGNGIVLDPVTMQKIVKYKNLY